MRPVSHRDCTPAQTCGNCRFSRLVAGKLDLLCFHGDEIEVAGEQSRYPVNADYVRLNGDNVSYMDGEEYSKVWAGRVVDGCTEVCDEWKPEQ